MTASERERDPLSTLMREATTLSEHEARAAKHAFLERVDREGAEPGRIRRVYLLAPLAAAAAIVFAFLAWPEGELTFDVTGAKNGGGYVRARADTPARVDFSDETRLEAAPNARLRIVEVRRDGARVSLEQGRLSVRVTHSEKSDWRFGAGPFDVRVTGTRFDLDWNPRAEKLALQLHEGSVEVRAFDESAPLPVRAGQRFLGDAGARTMRVVDADFEAAGDGDSASDVLDERDPRSEIVQSPAGDADPARRADIDDTAAKTARQATDAPWSSLVAKGKFEAVVERATQRGIAACLSGCNSSDLTALADAARYTGNDDLARRSLLALRKRFASSSGVRAAFLLGRLHEGGGRHDEALSWYETSFRESPSGEFAAESLAGKMRSTLALRGGSAAQPIAQEYLKRYPDGVHAATARKIAEP